MRNNAIVQVGQGAQAARFGARLPLALIAGPCQIESRAHALETAAALKEIAARRGIGLVYKSSFDKANRTSASGPRGLGLKASLPILAEIRETLGLPAITDVHEPSQCAPAAEAASTGASVFRPLLAARTIAEIARACAAHDRLRPSEPDVRAIAFAERAVAVAGENVADHAKPWRGRSRRSGSA